jgi:cytoskeleton protein RodZ
LRRVARFSAAIRPELANRFTGRGHNSMTLAELGAQLREERASLGFMVEDVAARLKIHARILRAIEEGDTDDLPHFTYTRGFIKGYALILGYSAEKITSLLNSLETCTDDLAPRKPVEKNLLDEVAGVKKGRKGRVFFLLLCLALLAGGGYYYYIRVFAGAVAVPGASLPPAADPETPAVSAPVSPWEEEPAPAEEPGNREEAPSAAENGPRPPAAEDAAAVPPALPATGQGNGPPASEAEPVSTSGFAPLPPATASVVAEPAPAANVPPNGMHQVVITAEADCWVHANTDNTETREFTLRAGDTFALPFRDSLTLRLGNAGGVKIVYDGLEMPPAGSPGQVRNVVFPPAG